MDADTIAIMVTIAASAVALWRVNKASMDRLHTDLAGMQRDIGELRERMARLEGLFDGFTKRESRPDA